MSFSDLFYPGSKTPRRASPAPVPELQEWEKKATKKTYRLGGRDVHLFKISALATALDKSEITIRGWMRDGYIPLAPIRLVASNADDAVKRGAHRMFTREMIQSAVDSFAKRGLLGKPRVEWTQHRDLPGEIRANWQRLSDEAFRPNN